MSDYTTNMSVEEYVAHRGLQVVHFDTDLQDFQFELESVEWDGGRRILFHFCGGKASVLASSRSGESA